MKKILVPTDFSKTSIDAFHYAYELAKVFNASIKLVHVHSGSFNPNEPLVLQPGKGFVDVVNERLKEMVDQLPDKSSGTVATKIDVECAALQGFTVSKIVKEAKKEAADLIVMGTTGNHDVLEMAIGSVSTGVAQRAHCSVLLIPKGIEYKGFDNILYASDFESAGQGMIQKNIDFANTFRAAMHFVHVSKKKEEQYEIVEDAIFETLFKDGEPAFAFNLVTIPSASVQKGLFQYADENRIDLIVLVNYHEKFLDNILSKSLTKEMGLYTKYPLMVYQADF